MKTNILRAIINLINIPTNELKEIYNNHNRVNSMGESLEVFVKDIFAGTLDCESETEKLEILSQTFSYLGNKSNPPDAMIKAGDAIEIKKIENSNSAIALNSSFPKKKLYSSSEMITSTCREAEDWQEKDMIYAVGIVDETKIKQLCLVYGMDYSASYEVYSRIKNTIKEGVESISGIEFSNTKELGHINCIDPLGITYMRVRAMWGIQNPWKVFSYVYEKNSEKEFNFFSIINVEKYNKFEKEERERFEQIVASNKDLIMKKVKIKNPDNPAKLIDAYLISYSK